MVFLNSETLVIKPNQKSSPSKIFPKFINSKVVTSLRFNQICNLKYRYTQCAVAILRLLPPVKMHPASRNASFLQVIPIGMQFWHALC